MNSYKKGESVFLIDRHGHPARRYTIKNVRKYKVNTKITLSDGSEWDAFTGVPWSRRDNSSYWGGVIAPWSEALQDEFDERLQEAAVNRCVSHWNSLTRGQRERLGNLSRQILSEAFNEKTDEQDSCCD